MKPRVAVFSTRFLPYSQTFVHDELSAHQRYETHVFCARRLSHERFPHPTVFAAGRLSEHSSLRVVSGIVVELFRAIPLLILIFVFYYGLPAAGIKMTPYMAVVLGLMLYNGSVLAEIFRAGIQALPRGQSEAAYALGMRKTQVMVLILTMVQRTLEKRWSVAR